MALIDIKAGVLEKVAEGALPIKENGSFDLSKLDYIIQREATKKDLTITVKYVPKEIKYKFVIYGEEK